MSLASPIGPLTMLLLTITAGTIASDTTATADRHKEVTQTIADFKSKDPGIQKFFAGSVGYAVFPSVGKGGFILGGAHGNGELIVGGKAIGKVSMTQVTVGAQVGGQSYSEILFFEDKSTLDKFKKSEFTTAAQVSAVALNSGASSNAKYLDGVLVFTVAKSGLMAEASLGGQKFSYTAY